MSPRDQVDPIESADIVDPLILAQGQLMYLDIPYNPSTPPFMAPTKRLGGFPPGAL